MIVALGMRPHTGWATVVAVAGDVESTVVVARRRIELSNDAVPRAVYHAARPLDLGEGIELVQRAEEVADECATSALADLLAELGAGGHRAAVAGVMGSGSRLPKKLADIVASHALVHAAEGNMFREALVSAAGYCDLPVAELLARDLYPRAALALHRTEDAIHALVAGLGQALGPPWRRDHKDATVAAWVARAETGPATP